MTAATQQAIIRAAREAGIDPSAALAIAERESAFDPSARSSRTIRGIFQMRGDLRRQYGVNDSLDPYEQAKGWGTFFRDTKADMSRRLGRDVSDAEGYAGHHFGAARAARMMRMDPGTDLADVFTSREMAENPHFGKAGTVGALLSGVTRDIGKRQQKFGGSVDLPDFAEFGDLLDLAGEGVAANQPPPPAAGGTGGAAIGGGTARPPLAPPVPSALLTQSRSHASRNAGALDLSGFGDLAS